MHSIDKTSQYTSPIDSNTVFCDCVKETQNESFWNGTACQLALSFNQTCANASTGYMCQSITQGTVCNDNNGNGVFTCQCPSQQYFNAASNKCSNQLSFNQSCNSSWMCLDIFGLDCLNGSCK